MEEALSLDTTIVSLLVKVGLGNLTSSLLLQFGCSLLESQYSRDSVGLKEECALFMRFTTWGEDKFVSKNQLWRFCLTMKVFKGRVIWEGSQKHLLFSLSAMSNSLWPHGSTPSFHALHFLFVFAQTHVHWVNDAIQPSHPLSPPFPPALNLSQNQGFSNKLVLCIRWPKHWSFSFSINPSKEYSGLILFRMDWLDFLAVQGTQESSLAPQDKSINSSVLSLLYGPSLTSINDY